MPVNPASVQCFSWYETDKSAKTVGYRLCLARAGCVPIQRRFLVGSYTDGTPAIVFAAGAVTPVRPQWAPTVWLSQDNLPRPGSRSPVDIPLYCPRVGYA